MPSLVEELQRDALDPSVGISDLLRKAYVVAAKLGLEAFREWLSSELNGYKDENVPPYRIVAGMMRVRRVNVWVPVKFPSAKMENKYSIHIEQGAVSAIDDLLKHDDGRSPFVQPLPPEVVFSLFTEGGGKEVVLHISRSSFVTMLESVRNVVLDWSIKLEADGIIGEGMSFKPEEKRIAKDNAESLQSPIYIFMQNSSIQNASPGASQNHG